MLTYTEGGAFGEDQVQQGIPAGRGAQNGQQHAGALFLHLDGGCEDIKGTTGEKFLRQGADEFRGGVVDIGFHHEAVISGIAAGGGLHERGAKEIGAVIEFAVTESVADLADDAKVFGRE